MSINLRSKVLQSFKTLHKTRQSVFKGDVNALSEARKKINEEYKKYKNVSEASTIEEMVKYANEVEEVLRKCVIQAKEVEPGKFEAQITKETLRLDNVPFKDCAVTEK